MVVPRARADRKGCRVADMTREAALGNLLRSMFSYEELRSFIVCDEELRSVREHLPPDGVPTLWFMAVVETLGRHGMIGREFFASLERERPRRVNEIREVSEQWLRAISDAAPQGRQSGRFRTLAIEIVGASFRRAFSLNILGRFANPSEIERVSRSIDECQGALRARTVEFHAEAGKESAEILLAMVGHLNRLDVLFQRMKHAASELGDRIDTQGVPELRKMYLEAERHRLNFVADLARFADATQVPLPTDPASEDPSKPRQLTDFN